MKKRRTAEKRHGSQLYLPKEEEARFTVEMLRESVHKAGDGSKYKESLLSDYASKPLLSLCHKRSISDLARQQLEEQKPEAKKLTVFQNQSILEMSQKMVSSLVMESEDQPSLSSRARKTGLSVDIQHLSFMPNQSQANSSMIANQSQEKEVGLSSRSVEKFQVFLKRKLISSSV